MSGTVMHQRPARQFDVELPVGFTDEDGRVHSTASIRKMTGHEEALMSDRKLRQNPPRLLTELIASCMIKLGDVQPVTRAIVTELSSSDRNYLLLQLRRITFGEEIESSYLCSACGSRTSRTHNLDELAVRRLDGDGSTGVVVELEDGWEDPDGELYTNMVFRLPTGIDEEKVGPVARENGSRGMNALLTRCLVSVGDMPSNRREAMGTKIVNELTMRDRAVIDRAFRRDMPGVDLTLEVECDSCGRIFPASLDMNGFFTAS